MKRPARLALGATAVSTLAGALFSAGGISGCTATPTQVPVRSLERSGRVGFLCLDVPTNPKPGLPMERCLTAPEVAQDAGIVPAGSQVGPNLYALVTQTTRGEVALVNLSTGNVIDEDPSVPGSSFLPVGANPVDIVATPGGAAAFVSVRQVAHAGIFALPAALVRPAVDGSRPAPTLSTWPSCSLPTAPGEMILVNDLPTAAGTRASCDSAYGAAPPAGPHGDIDAEGKGRQKLVVSLPELGGVAVIDAQTILDGAPGAFEACRVERWLPLEVKLPAPSPPPNPTGVACVAPLRPTPAAAPSVKPHPAGLSFSVTGQQLYVADLAAPVIHVLDMPTPCAPKELEPLLVTSIEDPKHTHVTSRVSVSDTLTKDLRRFLYAIDVFDGSAMVFDVTPGAPRTPVQRARPELVPFVARDRIKFGAPARDVILLQRDSPAAHPITGVAPYGTLCNPDPTATCDVLGSPTTCDVGTAFRTSADYTTGAGPVTLRGTFAFILLMTGQLAVIDVDDYDAPCRGPKAPTPLLGCGAMTGTDLRTSLEDSCGVVVRHAPRDAVFEITSDLAGHHSPGISTFPVLSDVSGTVKTHTADSPQMVSTGGGALSLVVGGVGQPISAGTIIVDNDAKQTLVMNLEDPRAQAADQGWSVTFEGALPGFRDKIGVFTNAPGSDPKKPTDRLVDPNSRFCANGVHSENAVREILAAYGQKKADIDDIAPGFADYVQMAGELPEFDDPYWRTPSGDCNFNDCSSRFGSVQAPTVSRDFEITEAYDDRVLIQPRPTLRTCAKNPDGTNPCDALKCTKNADGTFLCTDPPSAEKLKCCFPSLPRFSIRAGHQWIVAGDQSGFLHRVIASPVDGTCRDSCDPALARMNGRVFEAPATAENLPVPDYDPAKPFADMRPFLNPMFRFAIVSGGSQSVRDYQFRFVTQGSFVPMRIGLSLDGSNVDPQSIAQSPTGELAIPDGAFQGLVLVSTDTVSVSRQFF